MMTNIESKLFRWVGVGAILTAMAGCAVHKPTMEAAAVPDQFRSIKDTVFVMAADSSSIAQIPYDTFFVDSTLTRLIEQGLIHNNDLQIALKQIDIASLAYTQSKWGYVPTVNLNVGTAAINRPSNNSMNGSMMGQFTGKSYVEDYNTALDISWEIDVWGKIKGRKEATLASFLQTQEAAKAVQTQLVAQIAEGYYNLLMLDMQLDVSHRNLELIDSTLRMIHIQKKMGIVTSLSVQQQENAKDQLLATIPLLKKALVTQENGLSLLTGKMPGEIANRTRLSEMPTPEFKQVGLPAEMLRFRPDVKSGELYVRQALAQVHVSKVNMYPSLRITAQGGLNAFKASDWFSIPGSLFGTIAGSITQPILNGKQLKTQYEQDKIMAEQAEIDFKQTVLRAVGEVSNSLAAIELLGDQEEITKRLATRAQESVLTVNKLFRQDMASYLDIIVAQNNKLQAELDLAAIKAQKLSAITTLYRSLGGGWQ
ncbi:TolC family protein [Sphingobacterium tabacisoli]|uniref:TolC family protein n=1 Tax=Sphingobacterium tabacisoli TaxID=2044855 RepID=A0ABW5L761_9SPHI|nr:efflux transporter outer membrane subunit [Sphingobacterium tabacisoli]